MARYEHLPVYKTAMTMAVYLQETVRRFSRYDKYSLGTDLRDLSREILRLIIRANSVTEKTVPLARLVVTCDLLKVTLVLAKESRAFQNFNQFQHAAGLADALCRQSQGWLSAAKKTAGTANRQPMGRRAR